MSRPKTFCLVAKKKIENHTRRHCRGCRTFYMQEARLHGRAKAADDRWNNNPERLHAAEATKKVYIAVRRGDLARVKTLQCVNCGVGAQVYGHTDYARPLDVMPMCISCNKKRA